MYFRDRFYKDINSTRIYSISKTKIIKKNMVFMTRKILLVSEIYKLY